MVNVKSEGQPMMAEHEIQIINQLLDWLKPKLCLEFGAGNSTIYFPEKHEFIERWISIEDNGRYAEYANKRADKKRVNVFWVPDNSWYTDCVRYQKRKYDFILIDGACRENCLKTSIYMIKDDGIILLHDSGRHEYRRWMDKYKYQILCEGEQPIGKGYAHRGIALFQKCSKSENQTGQ